MSRSFRSRPLALVSALLLLGVLAYPEKLPAQVPLTAPASPVPYSPTKWEKEIAAFEAADREHPPKKHGILFIGSSSIRMWKTLAADFPGFNVLNRGFGGSQISDSIYFTPRIVLPYEPRQIVFYAGGNDVAVGKSPTKVAADFEEFATKVHTKLPATHIDFVSIAPNFKRWAQMPEVEQANRYVKAFCERNPDFLRYIDVHPVMLNADGVPLSDIYIADGLHMNAKGYALWTKKIGPLLSPEPIAEK